MKYTLHVLRIIPIVNHLLVGTIATDMMKTKPRKQEMHKRWIFWYTAKFLWYKWSTKYFWSREI